ncbi:DUF397 domain-containing protein [Actinophytocola sp.]|uniref:DUF397 domain-containing protein n=1 Tax=Actinophytocola sp. TaxID=1872138 RepID=UPI002ED1ED28
MIDSSSTWRKSSFSGSGGGECVEIARDEAVFGIRDSKNSAGPVLTFAEPQGLAFLIAVRRSRVSFTAVAYRWLPRPG